MDHHHQHHHPARNKAGGAQGNPVPPAEFICPISLELMRDPVTTCTGVTFDRTSIEKWFEKGHDTCPATMQSLHQNRTLVPNHALRSLIHHWCEEHPTSEYYLNSSSPIDKPQILLILDRIARDPTNLDALTRLKIKARESARNSRCIVEAGALPVLSSVLSSAFDERNLTEPPDKLRLQAIEESVSILALLPTSCAARRTLISPKILHAIAWVLRKGSPQGMMSAIALLDGLANDKGSQIAIGSTGGLLEAMVAILRQNGNQMMVNSSLRALLTICLPMRNRVRASQAGGVAALVELLPDSEGGVAEHILIVLELLCGCADGRAVFVDHALAIPAIVKKILRVSDTATEHALGILWSICTGSSSSAQSCIRERARGLGLFGKLLLLLRKDLSSGTRHKVIDILDKVYNAKMDYCQ